MRLISRGNTAELIEQTEHLVCKLFYPGYPKAYIEHELENAKAVFQLGIRTPRAYGLVSIDGRDGIIYEKVNGQTLADKMNRAGEELAVWLDRFAGMHKELLAHPMDSVVDYRDFLKLFAADSAETIRKINELEEGNSLLHGDFHPANIMVNEQEQLILVDMMNICRDPAIYDVARTYFLLGDNEKLQHRYLELMGYRLQDIRPYVEVILQIRENEIKKSNKE